MATTAVPTWNDVFQNYFNGPFKDWQISRGANPNDIQAWNVDSGSQKTKLALDQQYKDALEAYNKENGTNYQPDASVLGINAQPNKVTWQPGHGNWLENNLGITPGMLALGALALGTGGFGLLGEGAGAAGAAGAGEAVGSDVLANMGLGSAGLGGATEGSMLANLGLGGSDMMDAIGAGGGEASDAASTIGLSGPDAASAGGGRGASAGAGALSQLAQAANLGATGEASTLGDLLTSGAGNATAGEGGGTLAKFMREIGIAGPPGADGSVGAIDWSKPSTYANILKAIGTGASLLNVLGGGNQDIGKKSVAQLQAELAGPFNQWQPQFQAAADQMANRQYANRAPQPLQSQRTTSKFANGGSVDDSNPQFFSPGALAKIVGGTTGGQDDLVPARLSGGEHVIDADSVANVGDGNSAAGHRKLDEFIENLRAHKRSAPPSSIPPKAKAIQAYMGGR